MYPFSVTLNYRSSDEEHVLTHADTPMQAIQKVLEYLDERDGANSQRRWVETIEAHWLHIEVA